MKQAASALAALCLLGACQSTRMGGDVVRFHNGFAVQQGQTIAIRPVDPGLANSLEFGAYANQLGDRLGRLGFAPAPQGPSDLVAEFSYSQQTRDTSVDGSGRSPVNIGIGVGGGSGNFGLGGSINFPVGKSEPRSRGVRDTLVSVRIRSPKDDKVLWEGRVTSETLNVEANTLTAQMPVLLDALFTNFPGESGKTVRYTPPRQK